MKTLRFTFLFSALLFLISCSADRPQRDIAIIPLPAEMQEGHGTFVIDGNTKVFVDDTAFNHVAGYWISTFAIPSGLELEIVKNPAKKDIIRFEKINDPDLGDEGYRFISNKKSVVIQANTPAGAFYGVQTLLQLLPPQVYSPKKIDNVVWDVPAVTIRDYPRFKWRGMHLDVSRHFFPKSFIKTYLDLIAMHKMNVFHWHLTDNNGWRLEIKRYPKLTEISAWRVDRENEPWRERTPPKPGEKATYGGFYTQEDVKEIVRYAAERNIMVIPEIEMPGHTGEVFAAYPELSCSGKKSFVSPGGWPGQDIFCAGNDSVFVFLENVLDEVFELFPAPYVHIGGDEADKKTWKKCPKCQQRIKEEHLKDEDELQSWFIRKIEKYVVAHGKKLIGWDEILQGGLAPEATVMSWRGTQGGIESAKQGHDAIMCPGSHCYFDHYQADPDFEPEAIGGFTTLKKVYSYEPIPEELTAEEAKHILGGQGNVWTEFIPTPEHAEYMALPRMTALAEVLWSPKDKRNWLDFRKRLETQFQRFDYMGVNYSKGSWKVDIKAGRSEDGKSYLITMETEQPGYPVYYTLDGSEPTTDSKKYEKPFAVDTTTVVKAGIFKNGKIMEKASEQVIYFHKGSGKNAVLKNEPSKRYRANGVASLLDGLTGSDRHNDGKWLGFRFNNLDLLIDLGEETAVNEVILEYLHRQRSWIFAPADVLVEILDQNKQVVASEKLYPDIDLKTEKTIIGQVVATFDHVKGRYVHVVADPVNKCPDWHPAKGHRCWLFVDEVIVN